MPDNEFHPDDPRLTAYALGELDPTELAEVDLLLAASSAAQAALGEIRDLSARLTTELRQEPAPELTDAQRSAILVGNAEPIHAAVHPVRSISRRATRWISRFAAMAAMVALVAVAAFLPAPGNRSRDQLSSDYHVNGELEGLSSGERWQLSLQKREGLMEEFDHDALSLDSTVTAGTEITALSRSGTSGTTGSTGLPGSARAMGVTRSGPEDTYEDEAMVRDGSTRAAGNRKLNMNLQADDRKQGEKYDAAFGSEQGDKNKGPGLRTITRHKKSPSGKEQAEPKVAGGPQRGNRPHPSSRDDSGTQKDYSYAESAPQTAPGKPVSGIGDGESQGMVGGKPSTGEPSQSSITAGKHLFTQSRPVAGGGGGYGGGAPGVGGGSGSGNGPQTAAREAKADKFSKELKDVDESATGYVADIEYPELKKWQELTDRRRKSRREKIDGKIAGESFAVLPNLERNEEGRRRLYESLGTEAYDPITENPFLSSYEDPLSTFGVDVDTASYANVRRFLTQQQLPPPNAVRIEELVNYFSYDYPQPAGEQPFSVNVEAGRCPWAPGHGLVRIGLKGREIDRDKRPTSNLVFLVDVSGSMQAENKLPLVKMGLNLLTQQMTESDRVAIVTYSDTAVQRLESTNGTNKPAILGVIDSLQAGGSTNGAEGIQLAYRAALDHFIAGGTNRVILCTDGDFNVGVTGDDDLVKLIQERARTKVFFSVFGFGMGNLKDGKLEKLADKGNGQYAYIDSQREAKKVFVDDLAGTLVTIAKDVKIQVEFNPNQVGAYRLIGYENRVMASQDFNNDAKDAGDIGAGHTVTALYEILPAGDAPKPELGDTLRYRKAVVPQEGGLAHELLTVKLRYKLPEADTSTLVEVPLNDARAVPVSGVASDAVPTARKATSPDFNWASAVAAFGMILRDSQFRGQANFDMVLELAQGAKGEDKAGRRQEFIDLVKTTKALYGGGAPATVVVPAEPEVTPLTREQAEAKASVNGKYKNLLRIVEAPGDSASYGSFHEYGRWQGTSYLDQNNLPQGYWVYVAPNWYIWGDLTQRRE